jgi:hypothetical protein
MQLGDLASPELANYHRLLLSNKNSWIMDVSSKSVEDEEKRFGNFLSLASSVYTDV